MSNKRKITSIAFTGAAVALIGTPLAFAMGAFHVTNSSTTGHTTTLKGKIKAGTTAVVVDTTKNTTLTCKKATQSGVISKSTGPQIGQVKKKTWSSCTGPFGRTFKAHLTTSPKVVSISSNAADVFLKLSGNKISGKISSTGLVAPCKATMSGTSVPMTAVKAGNSLVINPRHAVTFRIKSAANCRGAINAGDKVYIASTYVSSSHKSP